MADFTTTPEDMKSLVAELQAAGAAAQRGAGAHPRTHTGVGRREVHWCRSEDESQSAD